MEKGGRGRGEPPFRTPHHTNTKGRRRKEWSLCFYKFEWLIQMLSCLHNGSVCEKGSQKASRYSDQSNKGLLTTNFGRDSQERLFRCSTYLFKPKQNGMSRHSTKESEAEIWFQLADDPFEDDSVSTAIMSSGIKGWAVEDRRSRFELVIWACLTFKDSKSSRRGETDSILIGAKIETFEGVQHVLWTNSMVSAALLVWIPKLWFEDKVGIEEVIFAHLTWLWKQR